MEKTSEITVWQSMHIPVSGTASGSGSGSGSDFEPTSKLLGSRIKSSDDQDIGKITDMMIDTQRERIAYAVLAEGGFFGQSNILHAIPWNALKYDADAKCFRLMVTAARIKEDPGFEQGTWPSMTNKRWADSLHRFYRLIPYWEADVSYGHT